MGEWQVTGRTAEGETVTVDVRARGYQHARILGLARLRAHYGRDVHIVSISELGEGPPLPPKRAAYARPVRQRQAERREQPSGETDF